MLSWHLSSLFRWLILTNSHFCLLECLMNFLENPLTSIGAFYFLGNILLIHLFIFACIFYAHQVCTINVTNGVVTLVWFIQVRSFFGLLFLWSWQYLSLWFLWTWHTRIIFYIHALRSNRCSISLKFFLILKAFNWIKWTTWCPLTHFEFFY